jgi:sulfopyruvate decarboxylase TPP-binding subunit
LKAHPPVSNVLLVNSLNKLVKRHVKTVWPVRLVINWVKTTKPRAANHAQVVFGRPTMVLLDALRVTKVQKELERKKQQLTMGVKIALRANI